MPALVAAGERLEEAGLVLWRGSGRLLMGCGEQTLFISAQVACRRVATARCASMVSHSYLKIRNAENNLLRPTSKASPNLKSWLEIRQCFTDSLMRDPARTWHGDAAGPRHPCPQGMRTLRCTVPTVPGWHRIPQYIPPRSGMLYVTLG